MLKYYFGYRSTMGMPFPIFWVEEDGIPVGGEVKVVKDNKWEITHPQFTNADRAAMKEKYPYREPQAD